MEKLNTESLRSKGKQRKAKADAEKERREEEELARKAMELEAEMEANMTIDERRIMERRRNEDGCGGRGGGSAWLGHGGEGQCDGGGGCGQVLFSLQRYVRCKFWTCVMLILIESN